MNIQTKTEARYDEPFRAQFHFSPPAHWMNDPNGLVYYKGEYHLFYQHDPKNLNLDPAWMHWGHAVSADLVHWTHLPIALYPDSIGSIWSGSAVVDAHNTSGLVPGGGLIAMFSYQNQSQGIAYSTDDGRTWTKYAHNPVLAADGPNFRDPKVFWHSETAQWVMLLGSTDRVKLYTSHNLIEWTFSSDFGADHGKQLGSWECPDLFPLPCEGQTKWVLIHSSGFETEHFSGAGSQYFVGSFDGYTFTNDNPPDLTLIIDHGPDNYGGVTFNNMTDGSRIFLSWMSNWRYALKVPTASWRGAMTIPRILSLQQFAEGVRLVQTPVAQVAQLRRNHRHWKDQTLKPDQNLLSDLTAKSFELIAVFEPGSASRFGFKVHKGVDQFTQVTYDVHRQLLSVDRTHAGIGDFDTAFNTMYQAPLSIIENQIKLRVLVDWSSVEVFGGDGQTVITVQIFPETTSDQIEVFSEGGEARLSALDVYTLDRIW